MPTEPETTIRHHTTTDQRTSFAKTHFYVRSLSTAAHLATIGVLVEPSVDGRWLAPITAKRDAHRFEVTFAALHAGCLRREREAAEMKKVTSHDHAS